MKKNRKTLFVTSGDPDGIGFEVATKALCKLSAKFFTDNRVFLFTTEKAEKKHLKVLKEKFTLVVLWASSKSFSVGQPHFPLSAKKPLLYLVIASDSPADWIYNLAKICLNDPTKFALVTGPLSKTLIRSSGYGAIGHTEILSQVAKTKDIYMGFVGQFFNVVLLTGHVPLSNVSREIRKVNWRRVAVVTSDFISSIEPKRKPIALVGMNPHAGEKNLISNGEEAFLSQKMKLFNVDIVGPLVPDAAFLKTNWNRYSTYLCCYHDQGLIPFKAIHGQDSGVHVTLGIPFVRTSVDHGTAKEIFGKGIANPNSMQEAILLASKMLSGPV